MSGWLGSSCVVIVFAVVEWDPRVVIIPFINEVRVVLGAEVWGSLLMVCGISGVRC